MLARAIGLNLEHKLQKTSINESTALERLLHLLSFALRPLGGSQKVYYVKFYARVAHKRSATWEWQLPPLNLTHGWLTRGLLHFCYVGMAASSSKFYLWVAHKRSATFQWLLP